MAKLKYGNDVIEQITKPLEKLDKQIEDLKVEQDKLQKKLDKDRNNFSVEVVERNEATQGKLGTIGRAISEAKAHRLELIDDNGYSNYNSAKSVIDTVRKEEKHAMEDKNEQIRSKIEEIQELYFDIKDYDTEIQTNLQEFVEEVKPYLSSEEDAETYNNVYRTAGGMLDNQLTRINTYTRLSVVDLVPETQYEIKGLLPPVKALRRKR